MGPDLQHNGAKSGEEWKRTVRGYFTPQCPDIAPIPDYAEELDDELLTFEEIQIESNSYRWIARDRLTSGPVASSSAEYGSHSRGRNDPTVDAEL